MLRFVVLFAVVFAVVTAGGGEVENKNDEGGADNKRTYILYGVFIFLKIEHKRHRQTILYQYHHRANS